MKVTFVHIGREQLGIEWLSAVLKAHGHEVHLAYDPGLFTPHDNLFYNPSVATFFAQTKRVLKAIEDSAPDLLAFTAYTDSYAWVKSLAQEIRSVSKVPILIGGVHPTFAPEAVVADEIADYVVIGEGEEVILDLVTALERGERRTDIPNTWCSKDGFVIRNPVRRPMTMDKLPLPDKSLFEDHIRYRDDYMILTSRGCPFNCTFCCESAYNLLYGKEFFRRRSVEHVMQELIQNKQRYNYREIMFFDSILFTDEVWLRRLLDWYSREIRVPFRCEGHVEFLDLAKAQLLKESGCYCVNFGLQTMNPTIRRSLLNRYERQDHIEQALNYCDRVGLKYDIDLIMDLPGEQIEDLEHAARFLSRGRYLNRIKTINLTYFPGTPLLAYAREQGLVSDEEIKALEHGQILGSFYHHDLLVTESEKQRKKAFKALYKITPLLSPSFVNRVLTTNHYRILGRLPVAVIIALELMVAARNYDLRYLIHYKRFIVSVLKGLTEKVIG